MSFKILSTDFKNVLDTRKIEAKDPTFCPHCETGIQPIVIFAGHSIKEHLRTSGYSGTLSVGHLTTVLQCPKCESFAFTRHVFSPSTNTASLLEHYPHPKKKSDFPIEIRNVSPQFEQIYNQALQSEAYSLDELSGIGYRKALEFLVKDYLIFLSSNEQEIEKIKTEHLSESIKRLDQDIKCLATAATWLGNDHTHYTRRFDGKTIEEMKIFIDFVASDIHRMIVLENAKNLIDGKK